MHHRVTNEPPGPRQNQDPILGKESRFLSSRVVALRSFVRRKLIGILPATVSACGHVSLKACFEARLPPESAMLRDRHNRRLDNIAQTIPGLDNWNGRPHGVRLESRRHSDAKRMLLTKTAEKGEVSGALRTILAVRLVGVVVVEPALLTTARIAVKETANGTVAHGAHAVH